MNNIVLKIAGKICRIGITRLRVQQQINEIPSAQLELQIPTDSNDADETQTLNAVGSFTTGASVVIELDNATLFSGYLTQKKMSLRGKLWSVRLEARHALQTLTFFPRSRVFRQQDDGAILNTLFRQAEVTMARTAAKQLSRQHEQLVQFRVSDWHFMRSRLLSTNCWMLPDAASNNVRVVPLAKPERQPHRLDRHSDRAGYSLYDIDLTFDNRFTPDSLSLQGWDIATQQLSPAFKSGTSQFDPWKTTSGIGPATPSWRRQAYLQAFSCLPETSLDTLARSWMNHLQLTGVQGRIELDGTRDFKLGESIELNKFGAGLDGTAILTGVNQRFDTAQGWRSELLIGMPGALLEPVPPVQSLHIATVAEFTADPQQLDRIPIYLPALNLPGESIFARLGKPWASHGSGFCFYPEPGDEVVVGFIENDPRYPIILDAMHNPKNNAPFPPDKKNNRKGLVMNSADAKASLLIDSENNTLTLSEGKSSITLTGKGAESLQLRADAIIQQAEKGLSLHGKTQVEITSASINMKK
ncbi:phage baseplate assembly protein V [Serratia inhibens]|nr:phage baseplate assembly protein V [Serratia inhibens]